MSANNNNDVPVFLTTSQVGGSKQSGIITTQINSVSGQVVIHLLLIRQFVDNCHTYLSYTKIKKLQGLQVGALNGSFGLSEYKIWIE